MAKTGKINPEFQAAPFFGESSFDPVEFARRQSMIQYQERRRKEEEKERNIAKGLDQLMIDLKGWDDKEGFNEIMSRQDKAYKMYMGLATKGINFVNPKTAADMTAYKALTDYQKETKELVDLRNSQKAKFDTFEKLRLEESKKQKEEQVVDWDQTGLNLSGALKDNTIRGRDAIINTALITKPQIGDSYKYVDEHRNALPKLDQIQEAYTDPDTGLVTTRMRVQWTPEKIEETKTKLRELYQQAPEKVKNAVKLYKSRTPQLESVPDEEVFVAQHMPEYQEKLINRISGSKGGGFEISFGGQKVKMSPGKFRQEPLPYGDKVYTNSYLFQTTKPLTVPVGSTGSAQYVASTWMPIQKGGTIEATPYIFNPATDEFVFNVTSNQKAPWVQNNSPVSIPRSVIGDLADDFPIEVDGKIKKLKDVYEPMRKVQDQLPDLSEDFWGTTKPSGYQPKFRK